MYPIAGQDISTLCWDSRGRSMCVSGENRCEGCKKVPRPVKGCYRGRYFEMLQPQTAEPTQEIARPRIGLNPSGDLQASRSEFGLARNTVRFEPLATVPSGGDGLATDRNVEVTDLTRCVDTPKPIRLDIVPADVCAQCQQYNEHCVCEGALSVETCVKCGQLKYDCWCSGEVFTNPKFIFEFSWRKSRGSEANVQLPNSHMHALNGSRGEVTGSDDMNTNDERKRLHKEAESAKHAKPIVNERNSDRAGRRKGQQRRRAALLDKQSSESAALVAKEEQRGSEASAQNSEEGRVREEVRIKYHCLSFQIHGVTLFVAPGGVFRVKTTLNEDEGELIEGSMAPLVLNPDKVTYSLTGRNVVQVPAVIITKTLPPFSYKGPDGNSVYKDTSAHDLFLPLLRQLQTFWQLPVYSLSVETAIRNYVVKAFSECACGLHGDQYFGLESVFQSTVQFYIYKIIAKTQNIDLTDNKEPLRNALHIYKTAWYNNYNVEQTGTFIKMNVKARHLPRTDGVLQFALRPNIAISNPSRWDKAWIPPNSSFFESSLAWSYTEPNYGEGCELSRHYVSVGLDLIPGCWDHSDVTDTRSLLDAVQKRLFSARDDEQVLWLNQQRWLADVTCELGPVDERVRKLLNYELEVSGSTYYLKRDPYWGVVNAIQHRPRVSVCGLDPDTNLRYDVLTRPTSAIMDFINQFMRDTSRSVPGLIADYLNTTASNLYDGAFSLFASGYSTYINRDTYARLPGPKRQERMRTLDGVQYEPKTGVCQPMLALKAELDKLNFEKASRVFMSYGPKSSFLAPDLITILKKRLSGRLTRKYPMKDGQILTVDCYTFTTPRTSDIEHLFREMIDIEKTPNTIIFGCFSDDSVIAWNLPSGMGFANVDISSCDSSNGPLIFELVYRMLYQLDPESAYCYLQQCRQKIRCENPQERSQYINIEFPTCFEGSGTALTTLLNTIASALICAGIVEIFLALPNLDFGEVIKRGAALVGHKVTVDHCKKDGRYVVERLQFLKFSPILTDKGLYVPSRNIGCIVRGLGKLVGDLTPTQLGLTTCSQEWKLLSASEKFQRFMAGVVAGYKNEASHPLLDGLRRRFPNPKHQGLKYTQVLEVDGDYSSHTLDPLSLLNRYDVDVEMIRQSEILCQELTLGSVVRFPLFYEAMVLDYGMDRREASPLHSTFTNVGVDFKLLA